MNLLFSILFSLSLAFNYGPDRTKSFLVCYQFTLPNGNWGTGDCISKTDGPFLNRDNFFANQRGVLSHQYRCDSAAVQLRISNIIELTKVQADEYLR